VHPLGAPPAMPDDVPIELRRIAAGALEPEPDKRTSDPEDFRLAIAAFLQHRGALRLVERGHRERVRAADAHRCDDDVAWERAWLAADLAYRASLEEWPQCEEAAEGARDLAALRVEHALASDEPQLAARLLEANADLPSDLRRRVTAAVERVEVEQERLRKLVTDADRRFGHRMRGIMGAVFGLLWVGFWCYVAFVPPEGVTVMVGFTAGFGLIGLAVIATRAKQLLQNRINRTSMWVIVTGLVLNIVWLLGASWLGLEMRMVSIGLLLVWALFASGMASLMDPWGAVSFVGFATAFLVACYEPAWTPWAVLGSNAVLLLNQVVLNIARSRRGFETLPKVGTRSRAGAPSGFR